MGYAVRTADYFYARWINWKTKNEAGEELYDLRRDPQENINIINRDNNILDIRDNMKTLMPAHWQ
jgi:hypothetical protein